MSVIEDRQRGFLQAVLASPASRTTLVLGKTLGGVAIALTQALAFIALAPLAGFAYSSIAWGVLLAALVSAALALSALGFAVAWWLDSTQGYHVVMSVVLIPAWIVSSAMFPSAGAPAWLATVMRVNPMAYSVSAVRRALTGAPASGLELAISIGFALATIVLAGFVCTKSERRA
jgi:ABC-2 type transport system permease protein